MNNTQPTILSIDPAKVSGIAYLKNNKITVFNCECTKPSDFFPWMQFNGFHQGLDCILLEEYIYFGGKNRTSKQNPLTTRELIKRIGHYQFRPMEIDIPVHMMHVGEVRSGLGIEGKKSETKKKVNVILRELTNCILSTDISDAVAQLLFYLEHESLDSIKQYDFERIKNVKVKQ